MQDLGPNVRDKGHHANQDADNVDNIVPVTEHLARAAAAHAKLLLGLHGASERCCHQGSLEKRGINLASGRVTGSHGEVINQFEDEELGECSTKVRYAMNVMLANWQKHLMIFSVALT